jgi:hypothetical protein
LEAGWPVRAVTGNANSPKDQTLSAFDRHAFVFEQPEGLSISFEQNLLISKAE